MVVSLSTFTKGFDVFKAIEQIDFNDSIVTVSHYFKNHEKGILQDNLKNTSKVDTLKIQFNFKTLVDSTSCVTFIDSSDVVLIKLYDKYNSIPKKFVNWISYGALWPMKADPWNKYQTTTPHNSKEVVYLISEHSERADKIYLIDIELAINKKGRKLIPLFGTDYVSSVVFKLVAKKVYFYGIANHKLELFEVNMAALIKE